MLALTALLSLAAMVSADQTFSLVGRGDRFTYNVEVKDDTLGFVTGGEIASFLLKEPSGYLISQGKEVIISREGLSLSTEDHSKDFGIENGHLRFNKQSTEFHACPVENFGYLLSSNGCPDGKEGVTITLDVVGAASDPTVPASSTASSSSADPAEVTVTSSHSTLVTITSCDEGVECHPTPAPIAPAANATVVKSHSTLVTITSCAEGVECKATKAPTVSSYEAGAAQAGLAAGAVALAGAMLL